MTKEQLQRECDFTGAMSIADRLLAKGSIAKHDYRKKEGKPNIGRLLGYRLKDGIFIIIPDEAEIVKQIFTNYLSGMGLLLIQKKLLEQRITLSKRGVYGVLVNEKYSGELRLQKTFTENHITKKRMINVGQLPQYHVQNAHEPIIDHKTFQAVQAKIVRRNKEYVPKNPMEDYPYSGLIKCDIYTASYHHKYAAAGTKYEKVV